MDSQNRMWQGIYFSMDMASILPRKSSAQILLHFLVLIPVLECKNNFSTTGSRNDILESSGYT